MKTASAEKKEMESQEAPPRPCAWTHGPLEQKCEEQLRWPPLLLTLFCHNHHHHTTNIISGERERGRDQRDKNKRADEFSLPNKTCKETEKREKPKIAQDNGGEKETIKKTGRLPAIITQVLIFDVVA